MSFKKDTCRSGNNKELNSNEKQVPFLNDRLSGLSVGLSQLSALNLFSQGVLRVFPRCHQEPLNLDRSLLR